MLIALRTAVHKIAGFDTVLADMATLAIEHLECDWYLLPKEKHRLLRCAAYTLWLLDSPDKGGVNAFTHKRVKRERFGRWFRRYPIVPMYGDMFTNLMHILQRCPSFRSVNPDDLFATYA
jgi:cytoplasmic FMR1 interacting protein